MKIKVLLFMSIGLLISGILLRVNNFLHPLPLVVILSGVVGKISYIIAKYKRGEYKPGIELIILYLGVLLFFTGLYIKKTNVDFNYLLLMIPGVLFKIVFVVLFIRKSIAQKNANF